MANDVITTFFLSAATPLGTVSRLSSLCDASRFDRVILLKGSTARRRSLLTAEAADEAERRGFAVKRVLSADGSDGLEAAFWERTAIIDSAAPCGIEPLYPSALEEVLWLGGCYDGKALRGRLSEIIGLAAKEAELCERGRRFLSAADELLGDNRRIAMEAADADKIRRQAARIAEKQFKPCSKGGETAFITSDCFHTPDCIRSIPPVGQLTVLQDEHGGCVGLLLKLLKEEAKRRGCPITAGYSPFAPFERIDLLMLPEQGLTFAVENGRFALAAAPDRVINARRFTDSARLSRFGARLRFNKKAARQFLERSRQLFGEAAALRGELDAIYQAALDPDGWEDCRRRLFEAAF